MAGNLTDFGEVEVLKWLLNLTPTYTPTATKLSLLTTNPSGDNGTTGAVEVSGTAYVRQAITWGVPAAGAVSNSVDITFPVAGSNWGTITGVQIWDTAGTNALWYGPLTVTKTVNNGDIFQIIAGNLVLSVD